MSPRQKSPSPHHLSDDNTDTRPGAHAHAHAHAHVHAASDDPPPATRRSTRAQNNHEDEVDQNGQAVESDDEVTRCVCGLQDYPGPPTAADLPVITDASLAEDAGGLFIQCDKCHVWQHGGCVGIMDESKSPENYFCELCEKKLHNVMTDQKGQRYSRYLPLFKSEPKSARKSSVTKDSETSKGRKERENAASRASVESSAAKRRSTMNSRQAYDDEETLRRVIEESKGENESTSTVRRGKRSRDEGSEESKHEIKRQRTGSASPDPPSTLRTTSQAAESDDETLLTKSNKKLRGSLAETLRQKEAREREKQRDQKRAEAAGRRSERAGRRRGEGSDTTSDDSQTNPLTLPTESEPVEDTPRPVATPVIPTSQPPSPPASAPPQPQPPGSSHKKTATGKKQKRLGRNQYSAPRVALSPNRAKSQPTIQQSNASSGDEPINATIETKHSPNSLNDTPGTTQPPTKLKPGKWGRGKNAKQAPIVPDTDTASTGSAKDRDKNQMSLTDMKKRTGLMIDYIAKAQVDMAGERTPLNGNGGPQVLGLQQQGEASSTSGFGDLSSREMMDILTRRIMAWQKEYAGDITTAAATASALSV